ncbi:MAG: acyl-CoA thioesterase [Candidatus Melainabacteria bacterium]|jgi:acyl-CoA thioester hydrolase
MFTLESEDKSTSERINFQKESNISDSSACASFPVSDYKANEMLSNKVQAKTKYSKDFFTTVRVIYADTDNMGVVYHSNYLRYFEIGRNEMLREIGLPYKLLEENNLYMPIMEAHLKYMRPARYDDLLTIKTVATQEEGKFLRCKIHCSVYHNEDLTTEGFTVHVFSNSTGKPTRPPKEIFSKVELALFG